MYATDLTEELKSKAWACKTPEEMFATIQEAGYDLNDKELKAFPSAVNGSWSSCDQDTNSGPY